MRSESIVASGDTSGRDASSPATCASVSTSTSSCGRAGADCEHAAAVGNATASDILRQTSPSDMCADLTIRAVVRACTLPTGPWSVGGSGCDCVLPRR